MGYTCVLLPFLFSVSIPLLAVPGAAQDRCTGQGATLALSFQAGLLSDIKKESLLGSPFFTRQLDGYKGLRVRAIRAGAGQRSGLTGALFLGRLDLLEHGGNGFLVADAANGLGKHWSQGQVADLGDGTGSIS